jgi:hypothetical protein
VQSSATKRTTVADIGTAVNAATLAALNTQITDATLIDTADARLSDARTPSAHDLDSHGSNTIAELSAIVSDATLARTDASQTFTGAQQTGVTTLTDGATIAIDAAASNAFKVTLGGARELSNPTNAVEGMSWTVRVIQDGTGSRALTFGTNYDWGDDNTAVDTSADAAAKERLISFYAVSATKILAVDAVGAY